MYQKIRSRIKLEWGDQDVSIGPGFPQITSQITPQIICLARSPLARSILQGSDFFVTTMGRSRIDLRGSLGQTQSR
ncbi:MAG: hypothetical protein DWI26_04135 [Planctomycetota bacterium]|nr:MAG: hypothetical protein DWI26_04135 [Planctomycetota bacterium]